MHGIYQDKVLHCRNCGVQFVWTSGEQAFYHSKGLLNEPSRCPSCRQMAKTSRQVGTRPLDGRPREYFPAVCDRCGIQTQVPFLPRTDRPVYCSACYDVVRAEGVPTGVR